MFMTYAIIILLVLVVILLVRSVTVTKAQLDKLQLKLENKIYADAVEKNRLYHSILGRMSSDRRHLHDHVESLRSKIDNLKNITQEADMQLFAVIDDLAEVSGYEVSVENQPAVPSIPEGDVLVLKKKDEELEVRPKKTVTYRKK